MVASSEKYHISLRILHWLMAVIILALIGVGWYMSELPKDYPGRGNFYFLHKSFGVTIIFLWAIRVFLRFKMGAPELPSAISKPMQKIIHAGHHMLYLLIIFVPVSGYLMSNMGGHGVSLFGVPMPTLFEKNKEWGGFFHESHGLVAYIMLALVVFHFLGVIKHRFFASKESDVLKRMI
ncbi:cytochrome b [Rickettsiales bacterium]|nr:cytochrome b [Rickettsiales bacterium]